MDSNDKEVQCVKCQFYNKYSQTCSKQQIHISLNYATEYESCIDYKKKID
ncbi:MAG: hypothetical protein WC365_08785 [Candidatus Babeliales bacterium]